MNTNTGIRALLNLKNIGTAFVRKVVVKDSFNGDDLFAQIKHITEINNRHYTEDEISKAIDDAFETGNKCHTERIGIVTFLDPAYPPTLRSVADRPVALYFKGNYKLTATMPIAVIGTREPNETGSKIASRVGTYLAANGWSISNGLATGIDADVYGADSSLYTHSIGILAGGLNYNTRTTLLKATARNAEKSLENGGLLLSEYEPDKKEDTFSVVNSCKLQASISLGLLLVQSSIAGGSKFTLKSFCSLPRPIGVIAPFADDVKLESYGGNRLIMEDGKGALCIITGLKKNNIQTSSITLLRSKNDYTLFEAAVRDAAAAAEQQIKSTLF